MPPAHAPPDPAETARRHLEAEVNATVKQLMEEFERLASLPPSEAAEPQSFNQRRHRVIRRIWALAHRCIDFGRRHGTPPGSPPSPPPGGAHD